MLCGHDEVNQQWFMQDGAPPNTARRVLTWISDHFGERVVGRMTQHEWAYTVPI